MNEVRLKEKLIALINDMPEDQLKDLLNHLETKQTGDRKYQRKEIPIAADYIIQNKTYKDFIKNISAGGVYITTQQSQSIGQDISINFTLPDYQESIRVYGKIVRKDPHGFAVEFDDELEELLKNS